ncbi:MAG: hypothetical protein H7831_15530 [Magnetococcus sp. WYHC-3]
MIAIKYGAQGVHLDNSEIEKLKIFTLGIVAALSQHKTFPADVMLAKSFAENILEILEVEVI